MAVKSVLDLGGSARILEILSNGPVRGLRNWPTMLREMRAGNVEARPYGTDDTRCTYTLSNRGRRRLAGHRGRFA